MKQGLNARSRPLKLQTQITCSAWMRPNPARHNHLKPSRKYHERPLMTQ